MMPRPAMSCSIMVRRASLKIVSSSPAAESWALSIKNDGATISKQKPYRLTEDRALSFCIVIEPTSLIQTDDGNKIEIPYRCGTPKDLPLSSLKIRNQACARNATGTRLIARFDVSNRQFTLGAASFLSSMSAATRRQLDKVKDTQYFVAVWPSCGKGCLSRTGCTSLLTI